MQCDTSYFDLSSKPNSLMGAVLFKQARPSGCFFQGGLRDLLRKPIKQLRYVSLHPEDAHRAPPLNYLFTFNTLNQAIGY
jgi:hypothetical protein